MPDTQNGFGLEETEARRRKAFVERVPCRCGHPGEHHAILCDRLTELLVQNNGSACSEPGCRCQKYEPREVARWSDPSVPCPHFSLERIDDGVSGGTVGIWRCSACGGLLLFPAQCPGGIRKILDRAAARDAEEGI